MCGIAGVVCFGESAHRMPYLRRMADSMRRRGPDDEGYVLFGREGAPRVFGGADTPSDTFGGRLPYLPAGELPHDGEVPEAVAGLAHRRLSVLDLSHRGHEPMCSPDGRHWLVLNGEVYNYREIRAELEGHGPPFTTGTDTEVVLRAFARWGPACLDRLNGMFALAIWDTEARQLLCARDRLGIKPFYYHRSPSRFLFASEIKALLASRQFVSGVDPDGFYHGMSLQIGPRPLTAFRGIRALPQAHWMTVGADGEVSTRRYWRIPVGPTDHGRPEQSYVEELEHHLEASVRRRLIADVPVGTFMSGGIDSTTVSALAAQAQPGIKAFTLAFEAGSRSDELAQAKATAAKHPMTHIVHETTLDYRLAWNRDMPLLYEEPFVMLSPHYVVARLAADNGVTVVLSGLGGDELLLGYRREKTLGRWRRYRRLAPLLALLPGWGGGMTRAKEFASLPTIAHYYVHRFSTFGRGERARLLRPDFLARVEQRDTAQVLIDQHGVAPEEFEDELQALCYLELVHCIGNHHLHRLDQFTMHFSLEGRVPLLDHELVEFAARVPSELKLCDGTPKYLLRRMAERHIDASSLHMKKIGFRLPMRDWIRGPLQDFVQAKLTALLGSGIFRPEAIEEARGLASGRKPQRKRHRKRRWLKVWQLVSTQLWLEAFFPDSALNVG